MSSHRMKRIFKQHALQRTEFKNNDVKLPESTETKSLERRSSIELLWSLKQNQQPTDDRYWLLNHIKFMTPTLAKINEYGVLLKARGHLPSCSIPTCMAGLTCQLCYFTNLSELGFPSATARKEQLLAYKKNNGDIASLMYGFAFAVKVWKGG